MLENLIEYIQAIIAEYGVWGVFIATLIEQAVAPIPSPIVPLAGGFFGLDSDLTWVEAMLRSLYLVALPVMVGTVLGSTVVYAIAYFGGKPLIDRYKKFLGLSWDDIDKVEKRLISGRSDEIVLFVLRVIPIVPGVGVSGFCGLVRYPFWSFTVVTLVGSFVRAVGLGLLGWQAGELYHEYSGTIERFENYILLGVVVVTLIALGYYYAFRRKK